jgi:hypothetical protein
MPSCILTGRATTITLDFSGFSGNWTRIEIEYDDTGTYTNSTYIDNPTTQKINSLSGSNEYQFRISIYYTHGGTDLCC